MQRCLERAQVLLVPLLNVVHVALGPYKLFSSISFSLELVVQVGIVYENSLCYNRLV